MATTKKTPTKRTPAKKTPAKPTVHTRSMARERSVLVANEIAAGKRNILEEEHSELPPNATPLDVLLMAMRRSYMVGGSLLAAEYAEKAAPYIHGKISSIELKNPTGVQGQQGAGQPIAFRVEFVDPAPTKPADE